MDLLTRPVGQDSVRQAPPPSRSHTHGDQWDMTLTVTASSIEHIRGITQAHLHFWGFQEVDTTLLGVSELLTNVLKHAGPKEARILVQCTADGVCVTVGDLESKLPIVKAVGPLSENGRGLVLLRALADGFGVTRTRSGKDVWFSVTYPSAEADRQGPR